jgi:hypothetical protein
MMIFNKDTDLHKLLATDQSGRFLQITNECITIPYQSLASCDLTIVPVLKFLWGMYWNNLALNWVNTLRPSCLTVTVNNDYTPKIAWEVVVYVQQLNADNKTDFLIDRITQNCSAGIIGVKNGDSLSLTTNHLIKAARQ